MAGTLGTVLSFLTVSGMLKLIMSLLMGVLQIYMPIGISFQFCWMVLLTSIQFGIVSLANLGQHTVLPYLAIHLQGDTCADARIICFHVALTAFELADIHLNLRGAVCIQWWIKLNSGQYNVDNARLHAQL